MGTTVPPWPPRREGAARRIPSTPPRHGIGAASGVGMRRFVRTLRDIASELKILALYMAGRILE